MELSDRKRQILKIVVDNYIESAEPVGSKTIAGLMGSSISSATIRNELAELVDLGYLEQPHTSAGRVPSPAGYRFYVNELMDQKQLTQEETEIINSSLKGPLGKADQVVAKAGQMISSFVNYPSYAMTGHKGVTTIERFELIFVDEHSFIAVVMLSDQTVKSQLMHTDLAYEKEKLPDMAHLLTTHFAHVSMAQMNEHLMNVSDQVSAELFLLLSKVVEYATSLLKEEKNQVFTSGASQLLNFPEYQDLSKAQDLMTFMVDNKENLPVPSGDESVQILIGPENVNEALKESSVVIASYDIGDNMRGLIGVVGPTRMDYAKVSARLSYFAESLTRMFGKKELPAKENES